MTFQPADTDTADIITADTARIIMNTATATVTHRIAMEINMATVMAEDMEINTDIAISMVKNPDIHMERNLKLVLKILNSPRKKRMQRKRFP